MPYHLSNRTAQAPWQKYDPNKPPPPKPPPTYQVCLGWPRDCACPSRLALVGENPGEDEDQLGIPFVGRSGRELDRFLDAYNIVPDSVFVTNIGRVYKIGNPDPAAEDIAVWEPLLKEELNAAKPIWIGAVGRVSTRFFLGDVDMDTVHGIPFLVRIPWLDNGRGGLVTVLPIYHPAAGFHSTEIQGAIAYDFAQLSLTVQGKLEPRDRDTADRFPDPDYRDLTDDAADLRHIAQSLASGTKFQPMLVAIDTEGLPGNPWGLSYSVQPGEAFVIRKVHGTAIQVFYQYLIDGIREGRIHDILHNSLHDLRVLRELGIPLPDGSFTDTMVLSYHLCIEPQGLKSLALRHCGMQMSSYDEIVQDAQDAIALEYYQLMEALSAEGVRWKTPARDVSVFTVGEGDSTFTIQVELDDVKEQQRLLKAAGLKVTRKKTTIPPSGPIGCGPFRYIHPYTVFERDKDTGQLVQRTKTPQQIDRRVRSAMNEYRAGEITAADLRKRWDNTDELVAEVVEEVIGPMREAGLDDVPLDRSIRYAARDADATIRVYPVLKAKHAAMALDRVSEIDHAIIPMVDRMQAEGIPVDIPYLQALSKDLEKRAIAVQEKIKTEFGVWINPNSGDQVADLLFRPKSDGGYGLVPTKYTKGTVDKDTGEVKKKRGSTVDKVLEGMRGEHPIVPLILEYRGLSKAKTSFADVAIRKAVPHPDGTMRVHCLFRITRVSSGRLSATGPNLLAIMGGALGEEIRDGYVAGDGYYFSEWDLSQIEMRHMAHEANDEFLISMFMNDEDVHTGTVDRTLHLNLPRPYKKNQVKKTDRDMAKRTGFGVITGIQPKGLVDQMRLQGIIVSEKEAEGWIDGWLRSCPAVPIYMAACHQEARRSGFVRDWAGRLRYLPGIHSPFRGIRAEAGRQSHSHKIQAGAQEIMKVAMDIVWTQVLPYWWERGKYIQPILQIHDALMFRHEKLTKEEWAELDAQIRAALYSAAPNGYRVPLDAGSGTAAKWGQLEH